MELCVSAMVRIAILDVDGGMSFGLRCTRCMVDFAWLVCVQNELSSRLQHEDEFTIGIALLGVLGYSLKMVSCLTRIHDAPVAWGVDMAYSDSCEWPCLGVHLSMA